MSLRPSIHCITKIDIELLITDVNCHPKHITLVITGALLTKDTRLKPTERASICIMPTKWNQ